MSVWRTGCAVGLLVLALIALTAAGAGADVSVCPGVGSCIEPRGVAVDFETGAVYVADKGNGRVDVFEEDGTEPATPPSFPFPNPIWIAVDNVASSPSHHDLYLSSGFTVKKLSPSGTLLDEFGEHGDGSPEPCQLEESNDPIAVGPGGDVYLADNYRKSAGVFVNRIVKFDAAGNCVGEVPLFEGVSPILDVAVDSIGNVYVSGIARVIRKYSPIGTLVEEFEDLDAKGLAVDPSDDLFAAQRKESTHFLTEYSSGGVILHRFAYASEALPATVALAAHHSADGEVYESTPAGVNYRSLPDPGPVFFPSSCQVKDNAPGSFRAVLQAEVNPEGKTTTVKAEYLTEAEWEAGGFSNPGVRVSDPVEIAAGTATKKGEEEAFSLQKGTVQVEPLEPETVYHCRIVATNADGSTTGEEGSFETGPPFEFGPVWSVEVGQGRATIFAEGNPKGAAATGQIEYVTDAQYQADGGSFAAAQLSAPPLDYGSGETMVLGRDGEGQPAHLSGLQPGTLYHYRLRAFNEGHPAGLVCPEEAVRQGSCPELEHTFRTYSSEEAKPDNRGYELVSPGEKNSAEVAGPPNGRGFIEPNSIQIFAGSPSGEAITYTSWTSFGQAQGAPATSQYLSTRNPASGWETRNISPFGFQSNLFVPPYLGFSDGLGFGAVTAGEAPLAPGCPAGVDNLYLREPSGALRCLTPEAPNTTRKFGFFFTFGGVSEDGSRAFFRARTSYAGAPGNTGINHLYETHEGQIHPVSILPGQSEAVSSGNSMFGARSCEETQTGQTFLRHAISADGSRAIWTHILTNECEPSVLALHPSQLLMRIGGSETVQLDAKQSGSGASGNGLYWAASGNGSVVYFTSPNKLISGVKAEPREEDLYRYDFNATPPLTDLTSGSGKGLVPGDVQGVLGASDDGSRIYFVARAALTPPTETGAAGEHAEAGRDNLYLYDAGEAKTSFVATLSPEDNLDWETQPKAHTSRVSPDGRHLAFLSVEAKALASYDNTVAKGKGRFGGGEHCQLDEIDNLIGGAACPEAFLYDAQTRSLRCASCNPSGARPLGPANLPGWTNMAEGPHYLSDDGSRLFFESFDRLLPADESPVRDVYEFELPGAGSCDVADADFDPVSGGCLFLVSSGRGGDENHLIDASADGRDVFFSTRDPLLPGRDTNENYDIYDYRVGGGFAEPREEEVCGSEESCIPAGPTPPPPPNPATPSFTGPGNPKPKNCGKRRVRRHGRCVKAKKHRHGRKHARRHKHKHKARKRAAGKGRAGR